MSNFYELFQPARILFNQYIRMGINDGLWNKPKVVPKVLPKVVSKVIPHISD
jgi:hypothetical protein